MYGGSEYVDEDLPLPPFHEVFAFAFQPKNNKQSSQSNNFVQHSSSSNTKKRPLPKAQPVQPPQASNGNVLDDGNNIPPVPKVTPQFQVPSLPFNRAKKSKEFHNEELTG
jgi:hypothetical protein